MKLTFKEIGIITEALEQKRQNYAYYANERDEDGNLSWPDEAKRYEDIDKLIKKIESVEV